MWSVSEAKTFKRCQRQWYYKHRLASPKATKQPERRQAYLLGTLQSVAAWRGQVVDKTLETAIVPALMKKQILPVDDSIHEARSIFDRQLKFALGKRSHESGMTKTRAGLDFAALLTIEENDGLPESEINEAWSEVEKAIRNLYKQKRLWEKLQRARRLLAQRTLWHKLCGNQIRAIPDLVALYNDEAPIIIDWKVHYAGNRDSAFQLESYALALARSEGIDNNHEWNETNIRLAEIQLLTGQIRHYRLNEERVLEVENQILSSISEIELSTKGIEKAELVADDLPVASYAETCAACGFKKLCWRNTDNDRN